MKDYFCKICGETNPDKFYGTNRSKCKLCASEINKTNYRLKKKNPKSNLKKIKKTIKFGLVKSNKIKYRRKSINVRIFKTKQKLRCLSYEINSSGSHSYNKDSQESFIKKVIELQGDKYSFEKSNYISGRAPITVTCKKHNYDFTLEKAFLLTHKKFKKGKKRKFAVGSCPKCQEEYERKIKLDFIERLKKIHNYEYEYDVDNYVNAYTPFNAYCKKHKITFPVTGKNHVKKNVQICPECKKERISQIKLNSTKTINGKRYYFCEIHGSVPIGKSRESKKGCPLCNTEKWNKIYEEQRKKKILTKIQKQTEKKKLQTEKREKEIQQIKDILKNEFSNKYQFIEFIDGGRYLQNCKVRLYNYLLEKERIVVASSIIRGQLSKKDNNILRNHVSFEEAKKRVRKLGITSFREYKEWHVRTKQTEMPSNPHRVYKKEWISHYDFFGTNPKKSMSQGERRISEYFNRKGIEYVYQKKFPDCKDKRMLPFDFYLPYYNTIVEFDGDHHFVEVEKWGKLDAVQKHDNIKNEYCKKNNINILRISYEYMINDTVEWMLDIELSKIAYNKAISDL